MPQDPQDPFASFAKLSDKPAAAEASSAGEFTQMFGSLRNPDVTPAPPAPAQAPGDTGGEFTQIFTPIARPSSPPPELLQTGADAGTESGEFTQFFSALSSRSAPSVEPAAVPAKPLVAGPSASAPTPSTSGQEPGTFTQLFQQIELPPSAAPAATPAAAQPPITTPATSQGPTAPSALAGTPAFGAPAPQGSFTEIFSAAPRGNTASPSSPAAQSVQRKDFQAPPPPRSPDAEASFTELFRAAPTPQAAPFLGQAAAPAPPPATPQNSFPGFAPAASAQPLSGAGDFTRLMQNLDQPGSAVAKASAPAAPEPPPPYFSDSLHTAQGGESEFTRVLRGNAFREQGSPQVAGAPLAGTARAPGLAIAPEPAKAEATAETAKKPSRLVLLLVVINVVLLLVILLIVLLVLRHRH